MADMDTIAELVASRRRSLGITQEQLAFTIGVNRRVIGDLERGKPTIRTDILLRALEALGLDIRIEARS